MRAYLIRLVAAAILAAVLRRLAPENGSGRGTRLGAGLLVMITALSPLGSLNLVTAAEHLGQWGYVGGFTEESFQETANGLLEELIKDSAETYILDKAQTLGMELEAEVETVVQNGCPIPWRVRLRGDVPLEARMELTKMLREDLGIPEERQMW